MQHLAVPVQPGCHPFHALNYEFIKAQGSILLPQPAAAHDGAAGAPGRHELPGGHIQVDLLGTRGWEDGRVGWLARWAHSTTFPAWAAAGPLKERCYIARTLHPTQLCVWRWRPQRGLRPQALAGGACHCLVGWLSMCCCHHPPRRACWRPKLLRATGMAPLKSCMGLHGPADWAIHPVAGRHRGCGGACAIPGPEAQPAGCGPRQPRHRCVLRGGSLLPVHHQHLLLSARLPGWWWGNWSTLLCRSCLPHPRKEAPAASLGLPTTLPQWMSRTCCRCLHASMAGLKWTMPARYSTCSPTCSRRPR